MYRMITGDCSLDCVMCWWHSAATPLPTGTAQELIEGWQR